MKKLLLIGALWAHLPVQSDDTATVVATTAAAICVGSVLTYAIAFRESNNAKIERVNQAHNWFKKSQAMRALYQIQSIEQLQYFLAYSSLIQMQELQFQSDVVEVLYKSMDARYNSWFKPWNWNKRMKESFAIISKIYEITALFQMIKKYERFIRSFGAAVHYDFVLENVQLITKGSAVYPMNRCFDIVYADLVTLKKHNYGQVILDGVLIQILEQVLSLIVSHPVYIQEKQKQEEIRLKEEALKIERQKVEAQRLQAAAQAEQAYAMQERNRIEAERLKNENTDRRVRV